MNKAQQQFLEDDRRLLEDFKAKAEALEQFLESHSGSEPDFEHRASLLQEEMYAAGERVKNHKPPVSWLTSLLFKLRGRLTG
ncbi:hypothetical protein [Pseudomonas nitroreducens]|uniref:hypothetical protein n=1 Tax=Pseudomonas nitroreducens TaxID=46680 RepID=UPI002D7E8251|nr:hypothetical protein [Pseudomonas nitroreducens]